jgi:purine-cytosine permease-like protein
MVICLRERCSAIRPIAKMGRVLSGADLFLLWAGSAIAVDVWYSGGAMGGIGWSSGIAMILLGSFTGSAILAAAGVIGSDHGIPSMVSSRLAYGIRGSYLLSAINYLTLVGWTAWMININASAADMIGQILFGFQGFYIWIFVLRCSLHSDGAPWCRWLEAVLKGDGGCAHRNNDSYQRIASNIVRA